MSRADNRTAADRLQAALLQRKTAGVASAEERDRLNRVIVRTHHLASALDDATVAPADAGAPAQVGAAASELGYGLRLNLWWSADFPRQVLKDLSEICSAQARALAGMFREMRDERGVAPRDPRVVPVVIGRVWLSSIASQLASRATGGRRG